MADKETCPACESHTSGVLAAFREGAPCPYCGLPYEAAMAVEAAQKRGADKQMTERYMDAAKRAAKAEKELALLRAKLATIRRVADDTTS